MKRNTFFIIAMLSLLVALFVGYNAQAGDKCCAGDGKAAMTTCCQNGGDKGCTCKDNCCANGCVDKSHCENNCKCPCATKTTNSGAKNLSCGPGQCKPADCKMQSSK